MKNKSPMEADESTKATLPITSPKSGQPPHSITLILRGFTTSKGTVADKENFYIFMVRAIKKSIRITLKKKILKPVGFAFNIPKPEIRKIIPELKSHLIGYNFILDEKEKNISYRINFIREFFRNSCHQQVFKIITDLMLLDQNFSNLCKRFNIFCCKHENHSELCEAKWSGFKFYLRNYFIHDISEMKNEDKIFDLLVLV